MKRESGAEAVFVYATKSQTLQLDRVRLCRAIKSRTRATRSRDKIARVTPV